MPRSVAESPAPGERERWAELGRRRSIYLLTLAAPLFAGALFVFAERLFLRSPRPGGGLAGGRAWLVPVVLGFGLAWAAAAVAAWWRMSRWPCPRCGKPFLFDRGGFLFVRPRQCAHCRLPAPRRPT